MKYKKIVFAGDSITDADHLWEPGEDGLGQGYVHMISEALKKRRHEMPELVNSGFNGYRAEDLLRRWNQVCLRKKPDLVTLLIGVNEVGAAMEGMAVSKEQFRKNYERLVTEVLDTGADMILMEPFLFVWPAYLINWRVYLEDTILPVVDEIAEKYDLPLIHLDRPLRELAEKYGVEQITVDGIHLTERGNHYLADMWLKQLQV